MYQFKNPDYYANYIIIGCQTLTVRDGVVTIDDIEEKHKYEKGLAHNGFLPVVADNTQPQVQPQVPIFHLEDTEPSETEH